MDDLTVIAVTRRFVIALDANGSRHRVETPGGRAAVEKGDTLTPEAFRALSHPETGSSTAP